MGEKKARKRTAKGRLSLEQQFCHFLRGASDNGKESPSRLIGL